MGKTQDRDIWVAINTSSGEGRDKMDRNKIGINMNVKEDGRREDIGKDRRPKRKRLF